MRYLVRIFNFYGKPGANEDRSTLPELQIQDRVSGTGAAAIWFKWQVERGLEMQMPLKRQGPAFQAVSK
jgi:hypothetical protein